MMHYLPSIAGVAVLSILITRMLIPLSHAVGLLDRPLGRKVHSGAIPLVGGISIYLSVVIGSVAFLDLPETFVSVALICGLLTSIGVLDDRYPLQPVYRLILQLISGLAIAGIGVKVSTLGNLIGIGSIQLGLLAIPFTAVAITGLCNAYNMVDGIDGLAGGLTLVSMLSLLYLVQDHTQENEIALMAFLCTSITIFMIFNLTIRSKIKIFMGDAGSTFLGCAVAISMIYFSQSGRDIITPATTLWLISIPMMDMLSTMLRRLTKRKSPFCADRTHLHHILTRGGLSNRQALISIIMAATGLAMLGIFLERVWPHNEAVSFLKRHNTQTNQQPRHSSQTLKKSRSYQRPRSDTGPKTHAPKNWTSSRTGHAADQKLT
jgi:UDP-GlcNAc:undecaprenyl-phosphate GlcNAc-1-phosphate transferase